MRKRIKRVDPEKIKEIKQRAHQWGIIAERMAVFMLKIKGYTILERRYRNSHGEVDIIATIGRTLVFVEVKARKDRGNALNSVTARKRLRIEKCAAAFIASHSRFHDAIVRFDVICCIPWQLPYHVKDAWRPVY